MSATLSSRGELGGINPLHLQCHLCGHFSKSHAHQLSHTASAHPKHLDGIAIGRLGNMVIYQSTAKLFHCYECFFTTKEFNKLYEHIITLHCMDRGKEGGEEGVRGETGGEEGGKVVKEAGEGSGDKSEVKTGEEGGESEEEGKESALKRKRRSEEEEEEGGNEEEKEEDGAQQRNKSSNSESSTLAEEKSVLCFDGTSYRYGCY